MKQVGFFSLELALLIEGGLKSSLQTFWRISFPGSTWERQLGGSASGLRLKSVLFKYGVGWHDTYKNRGGASRISFPGSTWERGNAVRGK
jgi:hypothetical protein